ncbi:MAG: glutathione S-transferase family protein [Pseudomonadota bacterium]
MKVTVHGSIVSPWVRRLVAFIEEKEIDYEVISVVPLGEPDPEFLKISPLGKIPVLEVSGRHMPDSLAACTFLEREAAEPALFPKENWDLGWMHWLCDYLATGLFAKVEAPLFVQRFVNPVYLGREPDQAVIDEALAAVPEHFDYLQSQLDDGRPYFLGEAVSLADLTAASIFINYFHAGEIVDQNRWPRLSGFVDRMLDRPSFTNILTKERELMGTASPLFAS